MALGKIKADTLEHSTAGTVDTQYVVNGSAKGWYHLDNDYSGADPNANQTNGVTIQDSFNIASLTDNGAGDFTMAWTNSFGNALYAITQQGQYRDDNTTYEYGFQAGIKGSPVAGNYTFLWEYSNGGNFDPSKWWAVSHGDLA
tara:strand:+ start:518 stop:946 length:429 start_codon:yes stop_codon:yes gene_type:complete